MVPCIHHRRGKMKGNINVRAGPEHRYLDRRHDMQQHREDRKVLEQEERSNVMKMNKWYAGLIAFAMGFALSVGTASAQLAAADMMRGQVTGDPTAMKLVPFYEVGESRFTAIGIQNLSKGMADETATKNEGDNDPTNNITERFLVDVSVYDESGTNMEAAAATVCLEKNAFGSVVLMMGEETMVMGSSTSMVTIYLPEMSMGYAELTMDNDMAADDTTSRYKDCGGRIPVMDTKAAADGSFVGTDTNRKGPEKMAVWAILQDVGTGFFGTEIPTASIMRTVDMGDSRVSHLACRNDDPDGTADADNGATRDTSSTTATAVHVDNTGGLFDSSRCGVIPDEFNKVATTNSETPIPTEATALARHNALANPKTMVAARFDISESNGSMSDIFVWLDTTKVKDPNSPLDIGTAIAATVYCEDGEKQLAPDGGDGDEDPDLLFIQTNNKVTMIDPADHPLANGPGMNLGDYTGKCMDEDGMGGRGVLRFSMPGDSQGGMVWTHVAQMDSHYRMNFLANSLSMGDDPTPTNPDNDG